jgi:translation elongation factor aEF-1 beta
MRLHRTIKRKEELRMGSVIISYKIFPTDITVDFNELKKRIEESLPEFASVYGFGEEPIAFGLNALIVHIKIPEDKSGVLEELEKRFEGISEISQVQTITVRRTSR